MKKVLFIDSVHTRCAEILEQTGYLCAQHFNKSAEELKAELKDYDACVIRSKFLLTAEILSNCTNLKCIGRAGAGMENIDVKFAESKGIICVHAPEGRVLRSHAASQTSGRQGPNTFESEWKVCFTKFIHKLFSFVQRIHDQLY